MGINGYVIDNVDESESVLFNIYDIIGSSSVESKVYQVWSPWMGTAGLPVRTPQAPATAASGEGGEGINFFPPPADSNIHYLAQGMVQKIFLVKKGRQVFLIYPVIENFPYDGFDSWADRGRYWNQWYEDKVFWCSAALMRGYAGNSFHATSVLAKLEENPKGAKRGADCDEE